MEARTEQTYQQRLSVRTSTTVDAEQRISTSLPRAGSNNAASLNSCIRPSAITSPDGLRLHCFHQVCERLPGYFMKSGQIQGPPGHGISHKSSPDKTGAIIFRHNQSYSLIYAQHILVHPAG